MALATGQTGAELFDEKILDSYKKTLAAAADRLRGVHYYDGHIHQAP